MNEVTRLRASNPLNIITSSISWVRSRVHGWLYHDYRIKAATAVVVVMVMGTGLHGMKCRVKSCEGVTATFHHLRKPRPLISRVESCWFWQKKKKKRNGADYFARSFGSIPPWKTWVINGRRKPQIEGLCHFYKSGNRQPFYHFSIRLLF